MPTAARRPSEARSAHSASSSRLLAPETIAQAQTSKTAVSEYQRPRRARGSDTRSRQGRRSAVLLASSGPSCTSAAGTGKEVTAGTGHLIIVELRHPNDQRSPCLLRYTPQPIKSRTSHTTPELDQALVTV